MQGNSFAVAKKDSPLCPTGGRYRILFGNNQYRLYTFPDA
jgi:hypothetical protein